MPKQAICQIKCHK